MEIQNAAKLRISPGKGASDDLGEVATASRMHLGRNLRVKTLASAGVSRLICARRVADVSARTASGLLCIDSYAFYNAPAFSIAIAS